MGEEGVAFPIRGQDWTMLPSAKWGVLCCLAPSQNLALYKTFLETPKSGCESVVWEHWDTGQEDWIACLRGCLGAASVIPVAFSTWGDPPRSRSPPCLQAAQIKSAADNLFFFFFPLAQLYLLSLLPWWPWGHFLSSKQRTSLLPSLYVKQPSCCLYLETLPSLPSPIFIDFTPLRSANFYPWLKFQLSSSEWQRSPSGSQEKIRGSLTTSRRRLCIPLS